MGRGASRRMRGAARGVEPRTRWRPGLAASMLVPLLLAGCLATPVPEGPDAPSTAVRALSCPEPCLRPIDAGARFEPAVAVNPKDPLHLVAASIDTSPDLHGGTRLVAARARLPRRRRDVEHHAASRRPRRRPAAPPRPVQCHGRPGPGLPAGRHGPRRRHRGRAPQPPAQSSYEDGRRARRAALHRRGEDVPRGGRGEGGRRRRGPRRRDARRAGQGVVRRGPRRDGAGGVGAHRGRHARAPVALRAREHRRLLLHRRGPRVGAPLRHRRRHAAPGALPAHPGRWRVACLLARPGGAEGVRGPLDRQGPDVGRRAHRRLHQVPRHGEGARPRGRARLPRLPRHERRARLPADAHPALVGRRRRHVERAPLARRARGGGADAPRARGLAGGGGLRHVLAPARGRRRASRGGVPRRPPLAGPRAGHDRGPPGDTGHYMGIAPLPDGSAFAVWNARRGGDFAVQGARVVAE